MDQSCSLEPIRGDAIYPIEVFYRVSGLSETRVRLARRDGIDLPRLKIGRRVLVRGTDAIRYIERLAEST